MVVTIFKFFCRYYGILLDKNIKISHNTLIKKYPFIETCTCKYANENPELIKSGKIIYVCDSYGAIIPYLRPNSQDLDIINRVQSEKQAENYSQKESIDNLLIEDMIILPTHLLRRLLSKYKNKPSFYKMIKLELVKRGVYGTKKYKINKEIDRLEESDFYDKYKRRRKIKCNKS